MILSNFKRHFKILIPGYSLLISLKIYENSNLSNIPEFKFKYFTNYLRLYTGSKSKIL